MTDTPSDVPPQKPGRGPLLIIFVTVFIDLLGFGIVLPLLPRYGKAFDIEGATLGLLMASFSAMQFLFAPIWGRVSDRIGRRPILMLGLAGSAGSYALFGYATHLGATEETLLGLGVLPWLFITRVGAGIAGATIPTAQAYIADVTGEHERGKGMALIGAAFGIGFTFGPLLGAAFVSDDPQAIPSPAPGYAAAVLSAIALLSAIFMLPESLKPGSRPRELHWFGIAQLRHAVKVRGVGLILATIFLTTFAFAQFETTLSLLTKVFGMADRNNFYIFAYIGFVLALSQGMLVRRLLPRLGEFRMGLIGVVLMTAGLLLIGVTAQQRSPGMLFAVLPVAVVGFSALNPSLQAMLSLCTSETEQGGILGVGQSLSALARILGPLVGISLFYEMATLPYWSGAGLMGLGVFLVLALRTVAVRTAPAESPQEA